ELGLWRCWLLLSTTGNGLKLLNFTLPTLELLLSNPALFLELVLPCKLFALLSCLLPCRLDLFGRGVLWHLKDIERLLILKGTEPFLNRLVRQPLVGVRLQCGQALWGDEFWDGWFCNFLGYR